MNYRYEVVKCLHWYEVRKIAYTKTGKRIDSLKAICHTDEKNAQLRANAENKAYTKEKARRKAHDNTTKALDAP